MTAGRGIFASSVGLCVALGGCAVGAQGSFRAAPRDREAAERCNAEGLTLIEQERFAEAAEKFAQAAEADPFLGPAHANRGVALLKLGRWYDAAVELRWACQLMPRASQPRANLGVLFERSGQYDLAEERLREALRLNPDDFEITGHLARIHVRQGIRTDETVAWLQMLATRDDDPAWRKWAGQELIAQ